MARKQNGGPNQCISIYRVILSPGNIQQHLKSTGSSFYMLPQYTVALRVSRNCSKVANGPKWSKFRIVYLLLQHSTLLCALMREVTQLKQPLNVRIFPKDDLFVLSLKRNYSLRWTSSDNLQAMYYYAGHHFHWVCFHPHNNWITRRM